MQVRIAGTENALDGHDEICLVSHEKFIDHRMTCVFSGKAWYPIREKGKDYTKCLMLETQDHLTSYQNGPFYFGG